MQKFHGVEQRYSKIFAMSRYRGNNCMITSIQRLKYFSIHVNNLHVNMIFTIMIKIMHLQHLFFIYIFDFLNTVNKTFKFFISIIS